MPIDYFAKPCPSIKWAFEKNTCAVRMVTVQGTLTLVLFQECFTVCVGTDYGGTMLNNKSTMLIVVWGLVLGVCWSIRSEALFDGDAHFRLDKILEGIGPQVIEAPSIPDGETIMRGKEYLYEALSKSALWDKQTLFLMAKKCFETVLNREGDHVQRARAKLYLALMYYMGWGISCNPGMAYKYLKPVAKQKYDEWSKVLAQLGLGEMFYLGQLGGANYKKAYEYFTFVAQQESIIWAKQHALIRLGQLYYSGKGVTAKYAKAAYSRYMTVADQDKNTAARAYAFLLLADYWDHRAHLEPWDIGGKAYGYYEKAASQAEVGWVRGYAWLKLGEIHAYEHNYIQARHCFELAVCQDAKDARAGAWVHLGDLYYAGQGVEKNVDTALAYYERVAKQSDSYFWKIQGWRNLCEIHYDTNPQGAQKYFESFIQNKEDAHAYGKGLLQAADDCMHRINFPKWFKYNEIALAQNLNEEIKVEVYISLGMKYRIGFGELLPAQPEKAVEYFKQAVLLNVHNEKKVFAYISLGEMYLKGLGVKKDEAQAAYYFLLALRTHAKREEKSQAYGYLAYMYNNGIGVKRNAERARGYFDLSAVLPI